MNGEPLYTSTPVVQGHAEWCESSGGITLYSMKLMVQAILRDVYHLCQQKPVLGIKVALCCQGKPFSLML